MKLIDYRTLQACPEASRQDRRLTAPSEDYFVMVVYSQPDEPGFEAILEGRVPQVVHIRERGTYMLVGRLLEEGRRFEYVRTRVAVVDIP